MPDVDAIDERLRTVERALTDDAEDLEPLADAADLATRVEEIKRRLDEVEGRLDDLDAATQALRGYVGNVRSVNRDVERRADAALAKAEQLEAAIGEREDEYGRDSEHEGIPAEVMIPDEPNETTPDHGDQRDAGLQEAFEHRNDEGGNGRVGTRGRQSSRGSTGDRIDPASGPRAESGRERASGESRRERTSTGSRRGRASTGSRHASARHDDGEETQDETAGGDGLLAELREAL